MMEESRTADRAGRMEEILGPAEPNIPTPWPALTEFAELNYRNKVGIIAQRGSREAKAGRDIAVHAALNGVPTVLFTGFPPAVCPDLLFIDRQPNPAAADVNHRAGQSIRGRGVGLIVIERYERLAPDARPTTRWDDPADDPEDLQPESKAEQLMWSVRDIRIDVPLLLTTVCSPQPDLTRPLSDWLHHDHPALVMTDVCQPTLLLRRMTPSTVEARLEVDVLAYRNGVHTVLDWAPQGR